MSGKTARRRRPGQDGPDHQDAPEDEEAEPLQGAALERCTTRRRRCRARRRSVLQQGRREDAMRIMLDARTTRRRHLRRLTDEVVETCCASDGISRASTRYRWSARWKRRRTNRARIPPKVPRRRLVSRAWNTPTSGIMNMPCWSTSAGPAGRPRRGRCHEGPARPTSTPCASASSTSTASFPELLRRRASC